MTITPDDLVRREVHYCASSLISTLAGSYLHDATTEYDLSVLQEQAYWLAAPIDDYEEAVTQAGWTQSPDGWCWREPTEEETAADDDALFSFLGSGPFIRVGTIGEAAERDDIEPYQREVFEHWIVSDWLADKLEAHGEKVDRDFAGLTIWARTTTGQAIAADYVVEQICAELNREDAA